jgi:hypothetical protein
MSTRGFPSHLLRGCVIAATLPAAAIGASAESAEAVAGAASAPPAGIVVDSAGVTMGPFYPVSGGAPVVLISLGGQALALPLENSKPTGSLGLQPRPELGEVFFESAKCTGKSWLDPSVAPAGTANFVMTFDEPGPTIYLGGGTAKTQTYQSYFHLRRDGTPVCIALTSSTRLQPVVQVMELGTIYVSPYHVQ